MGSLNPYPGPETNPVKNRKNDVFRELNPGEKPMISSLINSVHYFIDCVFILQIKDKYRLVVMHQRKVLIDKYYPTGRGCRIAFQKLFKDKACSEEIKAMWSHFYDPDKRWLDEKQSHLET